MAAIRSQNSGSYDGLADSPTQRCHGDFKTIASLKSRLPPISGVSLGGPARVWRPEGRAAGWETLKEFGVQERPGPCWHRTKPDSVMRAPSKATHGKRCDGRSTCCQSRRKPLSFSRFFLFYCAALLLLQPSNRNGRNPARKDLFVVATFRDAIAPFSVSPGVHFLVGLPRLPAPEDTP